MGVSVRCLESCGRGRVFTCLRTLPRCPCILRSQVTQCITTSPPQSEMETLRVTCCSPWRSCSRRQRCELHGAHRSMPPHKLRTVHFDAAHESRKQAGLEFAITEDRRNRQLYAYMQVQSSSYGSLVPKPVSDFRYLRLPVAATLLRVWDREHQTGCRNRSDNAAPAANKC